MVAGCDLGQICTKPGQYVTDYFQSAMLGVLCGPWYLWFFWGKGCFGTKPRLVLSWWGRGKTVNIAENSGIRTVFRGIRAVSVEKQDKMSAKEPLSSLWLKDKRERRCGKRQKRWDTRAVDTRLSGSHTVTIRSRLGMRERFFHKKSKNDIEIGVDCCCLGFYLSLRVLIYLVILPF